MTLIKTSFLSALAAVVKMLTLLSINKLLAIYVGPGGYAAIGQFQNAIQIFVTFASGALNSGVTKYTASNRDLPSAQHTYWSTAFAISVLGCIFFAIFIIYFSKELALVFFKDVQFYSLFFWLSAGLFFLVVNSLLLAILNGKREIRIYVASNIFGSLLSLIFTCVLVYFFGLYGALVSLAIYQSFSFFITVFLCFRTRWFSFSHLFLGIDKNAAKGLAKFSLMAVVSAICTPLCNFLIRNHIGVNVSWEAAGYWEAVSRLSFAYLMVITTTLGVYYLPKLSELHDSKLKTEMIYGYKIILPFAAISSLAIYLLRDDLIALLFSKEFAPASELFGWQMIGNCLKIGSLIMSYLILSRAAAKIFIFSEIAFSIVLVSLSVCLVDTLGLQGVAVAYALSYGFYWAIIFLSLKYSRIAV